jgi:hypothetical protein
VKRVFWAFLGLGVGVAGTVAATRWTKRQADRVSPQALAREAKGGLLDLTKLVNESIAEGRAEYDRREAELRGELDLAGPGRP